MIQKKSNMRLLLKNKKAQLMQNLTLLLTAGILVVIVIITLAIGSEVLDTFVTSPNNETLVDNVSMDGQAGLGNMSSQMGLIGTVVALTVVLLILVTLLFRNFRGGI